VGQLTIGPENITGTLRGEPAQKFTTIRVNDPGLVKDLDEYKVSYSGHYESKFLSTILSWVIPVGIFLMIWRFTMKKMGPGMGVMSFAKNKAKVFAKRDTQVTLADVAGIHEAKEELQEVVEFLSNPGKFQKLGGRIPKGVLLVGPPGTGKTLLARAVAGEAGVPLFSISGSEFVEMFVGVGAARVSDLFSQAAGQAPCIIFIDELDALGKARGMNVIGGHDEREHSDLSGCGWESLKAFFQEVLPEEGAVPGAVIAIQTFGDFLGFHPDLHVLCSDGCFHGDGVFRFSPAFDTKPLEEIFRHKVFKMLLSRGKITQELVDLVMS